jgi:hypothetical protein
LKYLLVKPTPIEKSALFLSHSSLLNNSQIKLLKLIKCLSSQLSSLSSQIINNKISSNNVFLVDEDRYVINEWAYSHFKEEHMIQGKLF